MESPAKAGPLLLQQPQARRLGAKRWKKGWFALFPASAHGVARLEFVLDGKDAASAADKRLGKKSVRLSDCLSVAPAPDCSPPKEGMAAFRLETRQRAFLLAAPPSEAADWVARLGQEAFPHSQAKPSAEGAEERTLEMALNSMYFSQGEVRDFLVTVQKTEASERCRLQGPYLLKTSPDSLVLAEPCSGRTLYTWPFRLLRRYGRDKVMFSFEAGRRCDSGPGNFTFETRQGNTIFHLVEAAIQAQKAQAGEEGNHRQSHPCWDSMEAPPIQDPMAHSPHLAGKEQRGAEDAMGPRLSQSPLEEEEVSLALPKGPIRRDLYTPGPSSHSSQALPYYKDEEDEETACVYSEPLDSLKGSRPDPLYTDPADSRLEGSEGPPKEFRPSSCLYEQVGSPAAESSPAHIYDEPEGRAPLPAPWPPAAIYHEASFPSQAWRTRGLESPADYALPYHSAGGGYVVPAPHRRAEQRPLKPCPAPKPPRSHKQPAVEPGGPGQGRAPFEAGHEGPKPGSGRDNNCNNSNNGRGQPPVEPIYSRVLKPSTAPHASGPHREEQSVDEGLLASVYEDLGEI